MAFCTNCGSNLGAEARFCTNCGSGVAVSAASVPPAPPSPAAAPPPGSSFAPAPPAPAAAAPPPVSSFAPPAAPFGAATPSPGGSFAPPAAPFGAATPSPGGSFAPPAAPFAPPPAGGFAPPPPFPPTEPPPGSSFLPPPPSPMGGAQPLDYDIQGDNLQVAMVRLKPGQELYAEAGRMVYKTPNVLWETRMGGNSLGDMLWGALKRKMMGQSLFLTYFKTTGDEGEVGFAGSYPGRIQVFELAAGQSVLVERDSFLFAESSAQLNIAFVKKLGAGFFGGEGFILEKLTGPGAVFIHGGGDFIEFPLGPGEQIQVETGNIVAFDESVTYDIQFVGSIKTAMFGGEGLFLATLTGPGKVIVQSMTLEKMRRQLAPYQHGGDEHKSGIDLFTGIFDNTD